jgi:hypothetical protein
MSLNNVSSTINWYINALHRGVDKFAQSLPIIIKQQMTTTANRKLQSSRDAFLSAIKMSYDDYVLVVELDQENWLANATEQGKTSFDMKQGFFNSNKTKTAKNGNKYLVIPIQKDKNITPGTEKGQDFQERLLAVLDSPSYGIAKLKSQLDGSVVQSQQILNNDPKMGGLYRTRKFDNANDVYSGKRPRWGLVMFRVVSENGSKTGASWEHPGIKPANIFPDTQQWIDQALPDLLKGFINAEINNPGAT